jgi:CBS domain-containing protein
MPTVRDILARKGATVVTVPPSMSVFEAAQLMNERQFGAVVVTSGTKLEGIFTERDLMRRVVAARRDPASTTVGEVMTSGLVTTTLRASVEECAAIMTARRLRHLPIIEGDTLAGIVSITDLLASQVEEQASTIAQLSSYVYDNR